MSAPSPQEFRDLVRSQTDIVSLIGESISLQPRHGGRQYVGLCCFHDDHNPSLTVTPDRQTFRCWSCNTGGDCFTFLMEREKVTFPEALEILARRANIPIPQRLSGRTPDQESNRAQIFEALQWAEQQLHRALLELPEAEPARRYLAERGIDEADVREYRLGYHPFDRSWLVKRAETRFSRTLLQEARLIESRDCAIFYSGRVLFPIRNERGQAVSFGGRVLPGSDHPAKYWNGPESVVFHKSRLLYSIDLARDAIQQRKQVLVVEGYTACIACRRFGFPNTVATLGTALTDQHVTALKRYAPQVVLVFDGDEAGKRAARRALERFLSQGVDLRILTLPDGMDPDDFLRSKSTEEFERLVQEAPEAWEYQFRTARELHSLQTIDGRQRILGEMLDLLAAAPDMSGGLRESLYIANLAQRLQLPEEAIRKELKERRSQAPKRPSAEIPRRTPGQSAGGVRRVMAGQLSRDDRLEYDLLELVFACPEHASYAIRSDNTVMFRNGILNEVLQTCVCELEESGGLTVSALLGRIEDPDIKNLVVWIDEQAAAKELARKIDECGLDDEGCPVLLRRSLENMSWRQAERVHSHLAVQLSQNPGALDEATEAALRQAAEFHQQRATKKTTASASNRLPRS